jgi:DNA polymerase-1
MEERGIRVNTDRARELEEQCVQRINAISKELGFDPAKTSQLHRRLFEQPPIGLGLSVTHRTPTGKPQVNDDFLTKCNHPVAGLLLEWRKLQKQLTSYYRPYVVLAGKNQRLHSQFHQHRTTTGRLSCSDPNLTQIPRKSPIKALFIPEENRELWEIDYRAIELRMAAVYAQEEALLEIFANEGDVHQFTADQLNIDRDKAKTTNFLIVYGGWVDALVLLLRISEKEALSILTGWQRLYPKLFAKADEAKRSCERNNGNIKMWSGRYRHFRYKGEYRKAFNAIVQGGSFEIVKRSCLALQGSGYDIRNIVHDSVWIMHNPDGLLSIENAQHLMSGWTEEAFGLNFSTEAKRLS